MSRKAQPRPAAHCLLILLEPAPTLECAQGTRKELLPERVVGPCLARILPAWLSGPQAEAKRLCGQHPVRPSPHRASCCLPKPPCPPLTWWEAPRAPGAQGEQVRAVWEGGPSPSPRMGRAHTLPEGNAAFESQCIVGTLQTAFAP